jgi:hypothetical protein
MDREETDYTEQDVDNARTSVSFFVCMTAFFLACSFAIPFFFTPFAMASAGLAVLSKLVSFNLEHEVNRSQNDAKDDVDTIKNQLKEGSNSCQKKLPSTTE